ncbi:L protein [Mundri virus]|uniref:L protein n=1 Tax=Mundri virus TaxID=2913478 RepID=UPI002481A4FD|nr:L protein [Mundri virus]UJY53556.1 L protein [Mundri virus]
MDYPDDWNHTHDNIYICEEDNLHYYDPNYEDLFAEENVESAELINNQDYNLNSPLLFDYVENFYNYIFHSTSDPVFNHPDFTLYKKIISKFPHLGICKILNRDDVVRLSSVLLTGHCISEECRRFMSRWATQSLNTIEILRSFTLGWLGKADLQICDITQNMEALESPELNYLSLFVELHLVVSLMNAKSKTEIDALIQLLQGKVLSGRMSRERAYLLHNNTWGEVLVLRDHFIIPKMNLILDRNLVLAIKDTAIARFNTLFYFIISSEEYRYSKEERLRLLQLYGLGDQLVQAHGNSAYDGIKAIETICNGAICKHVEKYRPLFPHFTAFQEHVETSVAELSKKGLQQMVAIKNHIFAEKSLQMLLVYYSIFRHWSHPIIDVEQGLMKLEELVNRDVCVDEEYSNALASDLAHKILFKKYKEKKKWFVDIGQVAPDHPFFENIKLNTWPSKQQIQSFGDNWHRLPLIQCFEIPDVVDPAVLYSDKSHSLNRSEILQHLRNYPNKSIPTKRVLKTLLEEEAVDWPQFLARIDAVGLYEDELAIGLKPKEREEKIIGRYFSLMTWNMRNYFVFTEHIIKQHIVPLFSGLTMADDLQRLLEKIMLNSEGQGIATYEYITITNSIDYTKWNNLQREESTKPVFKVMGQFFGYPNLIARTHEIFQKSWIYYPSKPNKLQISNNQLRSCPGSLYFWNGQKGGLEGLRQKGWSVISLLMIEREARTRNTMVRCLAQGDNQIISCQYKTDSWATTADLITNLKNMRANNESIMRSIREGASKLGLIINEDETMQSIDYLNYGKLPLIRAKVMGLTPKRWSRVTCCTNDQLPSVGNLLSTVSTAALTVCHFSNNPSDAMIGFHFFGNMVLTLSNCHNPALRGDPSKFLSNPSLLSNPYFNMILLYLDPVLGGVGGTSLTRFLIRTFPDPVTEALSFWKLIFNSTSDNILQRICISVGSPRLAEFKADQLEKLVEAPYSLNIPRGISPSNMIKEEIKKQMNIKAEHINNQIIRDATIYHRDHEPQLVAWLSSIDPLFPKLLSEFANSTYIGLTKSLLGLLVNSRTLKNIFRVKFAKELDGIIVKSEIISLNSIWGIISRSTVLPTNSLIWDCSAELADQLRERSWGRKVLGMTVPHPLEMLENKVATGGECALCLQGEWKVTYVTTLAPQGIPKIKIDDPCGPYQPYLGSNTKEGTSILQPWEKETSLPLISRAANMRRAISWFVKPDSNLAKSILNNIKSLTGEDWSNCIHNFVRTGSPLHRFHCSRAAHGGFAACSPSILRWMIVTTDTMASLDQNYDFMFQPSMLYSQISSICQSTGKETIFHSHIRCSKCIREISDYTFESGWIYTPTDVSSVLRNWLPQNTNNWTTKTRIVREPIEEYDNWSLLSREEKCFNIGCTMGFCFGDKNLGGTQETETSSLFPIVIRNKLIPKYFFQGLLFGLKLSGALHLVHRRSLLMGPKSRTAVQGVFYYLIEEITLNTHFLNFISHGALYSEISNSPHKIPASYPLTKTDSGGVARGYLKHQMWNDFHVKNVDPLYIPWTFADLQSTHLLGSLGISVIANRIIKEGTISKIGRTRLKDLQELYIKLMNDELSCEEYSYILKYVSICNSELRHACRDLGDWTEPQQIGIYSWTLDVDDTTDKILLQFSDTPSPYVSHKRQRWVNPSISGLRLFQCATGSHYKVQGILKDLKLNPRDCLVGGDGSGGLSALCLRLYPNSLVIYNSLLLAEGIDLGGSHPSPPSAIMAMGEMSNRCVNLNTVWRNPSDLSKSDTWSYFKKLSKNLKIDLVLLDMEVTEVDVNNNIIMRLTENMHDILQEGGTLIIKTYVERIMDHEFNIVEKLSLNFINTYCYFSTFSSSFTSEIYLCFSDYTIKPFKMGYLTSQIKDVIWDMAYCNKSSTEEYKRAMGVYTKHHTIRGPPHHLIPDYRIDLSTLFVISGLDTGVAARLCSMEQMKSGRNLLSSILTGIALIHQKLFMTIGPPKEQKIIPTSGDLTKMLVPLFSLWTILAMQTGSEDCWELLHKIINLSFQKVKIIHNPISSNYKTCWELSFVVRPTPGLIKNVSLRKSLSSIGQWIRAIKLGLGDECTLPLSWAKIVSAANKLLKEYYPKGNLQMILNSSDIMYLVPSKLLE